MDNPYTKLLFICEASEQFIAASKVPEIDKFRLLGILSCLISCEEVLDKGRTTVPSGAVFEFENDKKTVDSRMDAIRSEIVALAQRIGRSDVLKLVEHRARQSRMGWVNDI